MCLYGQVSFCFKFYHNKNGKFYYNGANENNANFIVKQLKKVC